MIKKLFSIFFLFLFLFLFPSCVFGQEVKEEVFEGRIVKVIEEKKIRKEGKEWFYQKLEIFLTSKADEEKTVIVEVGKLPVVGQPRYRKGDRVLVTRDFNLEGEEIFVITDFLRTTSLVFLFLLFVILVIVVGRVRGVSSLVSLLISFLVIFFFILPKIYQGRDPVFVAIAGSILILPVSFYLSHGPNKKTTVAMIATFISLFITGVLAKFFIGKTKLSGFASEEAAFLQVVQPEVANIRGLLLAGIIIGTLGVLDDVTVSQAAIVEQLKKVNPKIKTKELFLRAMKVGQDHIASMVNTLVLVYTGASLPLLLLFIDNPLPFSQVLNFEIIAEEIVRTLIGSIGLILAVPLTTFLASFFVFQKGKS